MKIIHIITTIERGGAENQLVVLVKEQVRLGHSVLVLPLKGRHELKEEIEKVGATLDPSVSDKSLIHQILSISKLKKKYDVCHLHLPRAELLANLSISRCKVVVSKHNTEPFFPKAPTWLSRILARFVDLRSDSVIAISHSVANYLKDNKEVSADRKIKTIYYGFEDDSIQKSTDENLLRIRENTSNLVMTVARLTPQKDLETLLRAISKVSVHIPDIGLVIYGEGHLLEALRAVAKNLGIGDKTFFLGKTNNPRGAMKISDVFVLTSKYEGFGLVLVEAMSAGVPIVAANNTAIPEVLGIEHPYLFETGNQDMLASYLINVLEESNSNNRIIDYQNERLKQFSPDRMAVRVLEAYHG